MIAADLIARLAAGERIGERVALVVAHPDDETVGLGSRLALFDDLTLIHLTDGAPEDPIFAAHAGFDDRVAYAAARRDELVAALAALGARRARSIAYGLPDQGAHEQVGALIERLTADLHDHAAVITHAYEHGHPDHDTAALAVARACANLAPASPAILEFATYHRDRDKIAFGRFFPDAAAPETRLRIDAAALAAKRAAFAAHATQAGTLAEFDPGRETLRPAPGYDFGQLAPPGQAVYEFWDFRLTPEAWLLAVN